MTTKVVLLKDTNASGSDRTRDVHDLFIKKVRDAGLDKSVQVVRAGDLGIYNKGMVVKIMPGEIVYVNVHDEQLDAIVSKTLKNNETIKDLLFDSAKKQVRIVLRNCGVINPESMEEYIQHGGYQAIKRCLFDLTPEKTIEEIKTSGLRGRGGAGFPTGLKWFLARGSFGDQKYVICNGDEGDPGAYMDRSVLEGDPHSVLEGLLIAGYAVGAFKGFFYIRAEYPLAIKRIQTAIDQAYKAGLLGKNILGSDFSMDMEVRLGAGAFVCGEETALMASIEGKRGTPRPRPPYPSESGLWKKPSIVNNVETLANVPYIICTGAAGFAKMGTEKSKGTKVFALTGKVRNSGLIEIPMGTPLRTIVEDIGGGVASGKKMLAVQTGGPSGGIIPNNKFDTPVSYEHLIELGTFMGSGGMIVMDEDDCLVDIAKFYLGFCVDESCGKCAPCRIGGYQMLKILEKITRGNGSEEDIPALRRLAQAMQKGSLCALGQGAPNPVLSTLKNFGEEYRQHIEDKKCRAGKCTNLLQFTILDEHCKRCRLCVKNCPVNAISGDRDKGYVIDRDKCIKCGRCFEVCKFEAVARR
ncbi:MAG TPA: NADH-quinone oxidoreductase subunit J/K [Fibrobacteres bacterium]|jgi:NADH:ubiquinone oxidoreductase subunit F (NADH-binding)/NAD-dependent dihydropyrimidine dehydrogenase PreA subunit|nr:NADH-quinone oxidoreductase subunit J/K [Fibrobacterota bacterium]